MNQVYVEQRTLPGVGVSLLAWDITHHLYTRRVKGSIVVIAREPFSLMRVVRKHWLQLEKAVQRERAQTLDSLKIAELSRELLQMTTLKFVAKTPEETRADIFFITPAQISTIPPNCHTAYITCALREEEAARLHLNVRRAGLVVKYCLPTSH